MLASQRDIRRLQQVQSLLRERANTLATTLADLEQELRNNVEGDSLLDEATVDKVEGALLRADIFLSDNGPHNEADLQKVSRRAAQVRMLLLLRQELAAAMAGPDDDVFEDVLRRCRDARIVDAKVVRNRLKAIEVPRTLIKQLQEAVNAANLDINVLQRAVHSATENRPTTLSSKSAQLDLCISRAAQLLESLKSLDATLTKARKAHAQLLVSADHDITHIDRLRAELETFDRACQDAREQDSDEPIILTSTRELYEKWQREEVGGGGGGGFVVVGYYCGLLFVCLL